MCMEPGSYGHNPLEPGEVTKALWAWSNMRFATRVFTDPRVSAYFREDLGNFFWTPVRVLSDPGKWAQTKIDLFNNWKKLLDVQTPYSHLFRATVDKLQESAADYAVPFVIYRGLVWIYSEQVAQMRSKLFPAKTPLGMFNANWGMRFLVSNPIARPVVLLPFIVTYWTYSKMVTAGKSPESHDQLMRAHPDIADKLTYKVHSDSALGFSKNIENTSMKAMFDRRQSEQFAQAGTKAGFQSPFKPQYQNSFFKNTIGSGAADTTIFAQNAADPIVEDRRSFSHFMDIGATAHGPTG